MEESMVMKLFLSMESGNMYTDLNLPKTFSLELGEGLVSTVASAENNIFMLKTAIKYNRQAVLRFI